MNQRSLTAVLQHFRNELETVLRTVENARRRDHNVIAYDDATPVYLPAGTTASLLLYNLKVWSVRYKVPLTFIVERILERFERQRKPSGSGVITFGLSASIIGGVAARQYIEQAITVHFPNDEHMKMSRQPRPPLIKIRSSVPQHGSFLREYERQALHAQRVFESSLRRADRTASITGPRHYRKI